MRWWSTPKQVRKTEIQSQEVYQYRTGTASLLYSSLRRFTALFVSLFKSMAARHSFQQRIAKALLLIISVSYFSCLLPSALAVANGYELFLISNWFLLRKIDEDLWFEFILVVAVVARLLIYCWIFIRNGDGYTINGRVKLPGIILRPAKCIYFYLFVYWALLPNNYNF